MLKNDNNAYKNKLTIKINIILNKNENISLDLRNDMLLAIRDSYTDINLYNFDIDFKIAR